MAQFVIHTHGRLQEWVAEEKGYFREVGLEDYALETFSMAGMPQGQGPTGAYQTYETGRNASVSCACHWTVNMAASNHHGRLWADSYSVTPAGIFVRAESPYMKLADLANVEIDVGFQSGSHYATIQAMETAVDRQQVKLRFSGPPYDRLERLIAGRAEASTIFGAPLYIAEQLGFRKLADVSFMIIGLVPDAVDAANVAKYYQALRLAQADIDAGHQRYSRFYLNEIPSTYHGKIDVSAFGPGERLVFEPYSEKMYGDTHRWVEDRSIFEDAKVGRGAYQDVVLTA